MAVRSTQVATEVLRGGTPIVRCSQIAVEVLRGGTPIVRCSQIAVEVLRENISGARPQVAILGG